MLAGDENAMFIGELAQRILFGSGVRRDILMTIDVGTLLCLNIRTFAADFGIFQLTKFSAYATSRSPQAEISHWHPCDRVCDRFT